MEAWPAQQCQRTTWQVSLDGRIRVVPHISRHDESCIAGTGSSDLHRVLKVTHRQRESELEILAACCWHSERPLEPLDEFAGCRIASVATHEIVDVGDGVPSHRRLLHTALDCQEDPLRISKVRFANQRYVEQDVRVDENHLEYFCCTFS